MANYNVQLAKSSKGNDQLVIDDYIFSKNGKGKEAGVLYWICSKPGCKINAKAIGNQLVRRTTDISTTATPCLL